MKNHRIAKVQQGISLICNALLLRILMILLLFFLPSFVDFGIFVSEILSIIGKFFCLATPRETKGKDFIYLSLAIDIAYWIFIAFNIAINIGLIPIRVVPEFYIYGFMTFMIGMTVAKISGDISFLFFLRLLAKFIHSKELLEMATALLGAMIILVGISVAMFVVNPLIGGSIVLIGMLIAILSFLQYVRLLDGLRRKLKDFD